jgi:hypothetical protein
VGQTDRHARSEQSIRRTRTRQSGYRPNLDEQRQGYGRLRTWSVACLVHARFRLIVNEVYYPRLDIPQIRDLGFIVADGCGCWVEVKRLQNYSLRLLAPGTPAVEIVHIHQRFTLTLRVTPDPQRDVLAIEVTLAGDAADRAAAWH